MYVKSILKIGFSISRFHAEHNVFVTLLQQVIGDSLDIADISVVLIIADILICNLFRDLRLGR